MKQTPERVCACESVCARVCVGARDEEGEKWSDLVACRGWGGITENSTH